jgi:hypothetical protein
MLMYLCNEEYNFHQEHNKGAIEALGYQGADL